MDCITLNPYLDKDSIEPFIAESEKGAFLLCKTSNPGAGDLQDLNLVGAGPRVRPDVGSHTGLPLHTPRPVCEKMGWAC